MSARRSELTSKLIAGGRGIHHCLNAVGMRRHVSVAILCKCEINSFIKVGGERGVAGCCTQEQQKCLVLELPREKYSISGSWCY